MPPRTRSRRPVEPSQDRLRPTDVRTRGTALALAVLMLLAGCGEDAPARPASYDGCTSAHFPPDGTTVARLQVGGRAVPVRLVPADAADCAGSLVTRAHDGVVGTPVTDLHLDASSARVVRVGGRQLLAVDARTGGGETRTHLFTSRLQELRVDGRPLLPAVETGHRVPVDATCTKDGRIAVVTATAHQPPGIVLAWDVTRTTYDVGETVTRHRTESVVRAAADPVLRKQMPELYAGALLSDCR